MLVPRSTVSRSTVSGSRPWLAVLEDLEAAVASRERLLANSIDRNERLLHVAEPHGDETTEFVFPSAMDDPIPDRLAARATVLLRELEAQAGRIRGEQQRVREELLQLARSASHRP